MKTYTQKIRFSREFSVSANSAEEANEKMERLVDEVEFNSDVRCEGWYQFEDEEEESES